MERPEEPTRVLLVGLGTIARTHLAVLGRRADVEVVAGVDPAGGRQPFPVHPDLETALDTAGVVDLVVVATPTDTHVDLVTEVLRSSDAHVLSEKPLARTHADISRLLELDDVEERLSVAHHFAFSPEVEWARSLVHGHADWGPPTRILSVFNDAYAGLPGARRASYVSTWVDSGPNQLSLLAPFVDSWSLTSHSDDGMRVVTRLDHKGGRTLLTSNWQAADSSKQTTLQYLDGAVEVRLDHTSMTGLVLRDGEVVEHVVYVGTDGRKEAHYVGLYDAVLDGGGDERLGLPLALTVAELLEAAAATEEGPVTWSTISSGG